MHIPDGYLSPATCGTMYAVSLPFWYAAARRVRRVLTTRTVPVLALFAAFSFVLMMFNVPLPGGTTGHAVGGTLLAIALGPWAAVLGISVVLGIQALFFGDGGLLTFGANCFNMAIVLPLAGYVVYKLVSGRSQAASPRRLIGAIAGSYTGIVAASLVAGIELGLQPALFHSMDGTPLYAPYALNVALPAMLLGHALVAGPVEAIATGGVLAYLQRSHSELLVAAPGPKKEGKLWILWVAIAILAVATPLGLLASGTAWGEWGVNELKSLGLGFIPRGLEKIAGWWPAPLPGYGFPRMGAVTGYVLSAMAGVALVAVLLWTLGRWLVRQNASQPAAPAGGGRNRVKGQGFLAKNLAVFTGALESAMSTEESARRRGLPQTLDPRTKLLSCVLAITMVGLARSAWVLGIMFALALALVLMARLPLGPFLKRLLLFVPFTAVIAIPALFINHGNPLVNLPGNVVITLQGVHTAGLLVARVIDSMSFGMLLILTTRWTDLLMALRRFRLPALLVDVLGMTYRYIFVLLHTVNAMFLARRSRLIGGLSGGENRRWLNRTLAATMSKSQHLGEEVYLAMTARGYQGEIRVLDDLRLQKRDYWWLVFSLLSASLLLWGNHL